MVGIVGEVGDGPVEIDRAVLASKVTQLTVLRLCFVADKIVANSILVEVLAGAVTVAVCRNGLFVNVVR